jgi:hypothetical protein
MSLEVAGLRDSQASESIWGVSHITYAERHMVMFPQQMGGHYAQNLTYWTKHPDCQLHAVVRPLLSGQASF